MASTNAPDGQGDKGVTIVQDIPESLNRALLLIVKNFFSPEHFLIVYYILSAKCIKEENLRNKLQYDQKELRQKMASLKAEKLVREILEQQKNENGRSTSVIFYFINYRAIINVLMYKIDHMRQKLEAKEKEDTQKAMYKCTNCAAKYETLDVDRLLDPKTATLKCWRCHAEVVTDETGGPSRVTRTLLAKFNEQMQPLFYVAQELKGIQLAPFLLKDPDVSRYLDNDSSGGTIAQMKDSLDFHNREEKITLGGKAFSAHKNTPTLRYADQITVDLNADSNNHRVEETKQIPLWLQDDAIAGIESAQAVASVSDIIDSKDGQAGSSTVTLEMLRELEEEEPEPKRVKIEDDVQTTLMEVTNNEEEDNEDEEEEEEDTFVFVGGTKMPLNEVIGNEELIGQMTDAEKGEYERIWQEQFAM